MSKFSTEKTDRATSASFWGERIEFPVAFGSTKVVDWLKYNKNASIKISRIDENKYLIFDLSEYVPKEIWAMGKTSHPTEKWEAMFKLNKTINPHYNILLNELMGFLEKFYPEKSLYSFESYGTYLWIE